MKNNFIYPISEIRFKHYSCVKFLLVRISIYNSQLIILNLLLLNSPTNSHIDM